jgi:hypothetical protein
MIAAMAEKVSALAVEAALPAIINPVLDTMETLWIFLPWGDSVLINPSRIFSTDLASCN